MDDITRLEAQSDVLFNNLAGWEQSVINRIAKRIGKIGTMSAADVKALNNIAFVKQDMKEVLKELAEATGLNISQIREIYSDVIEEQHLENKPLYDYRNKTFVPFDENKELQSLVKAFSKTTAENMLNLSSIGAAHLGMLDQHGNFQPLEKFYTKALDKAVMQVSTGATDFYTAMRDTIEAMGGNGMRINYGSGVTRRLDSAVRQSLLWGAKQTSIAYSERIGEELDCDGIEIDYHSFPRPSHEFMQGKQYILGKARTINGILFESADKALEALEDYGCLHYKTPIICGVSEPRYDPKELERLKEQDKRLFDIDGKQMTGYEAKQAMRRLETAVRDQKSIREAARNSGDKVLSDRCTAKIKAYQKKYNQVSEITGIAPQHKRMSITKGLNTVKSIDFSGNSGIIKEAERISSSLNYAVKKDLTSSREFTSKIKSLTNDKELQRQFYAETKAMLEHRSGTNGEDLKLYNPRLKKWYRSTNGTEAGKPEYNDEIIQGFKDALPEELIVFHNHPAGMPPSIDDLNAAYERKYAKSYIICHDGKVFEYTAPKYEIPEVIYNGRIAKYIKEGYSEFEAQLRALEEIKDIYEFDFSEVRYNV